MNKAVYKLLNFQYASIMVNMCNNRIIVFFNNDTWVKDGSFLEGRSGVGRTFEEACEDYLAKLQGKTLVVHAGDVNRRKEFIVF